MSQIPEFTVHEQVTSNTNSRPGQRTRLQLTGAQLLDSDPYGSGVAPTSMVLDRNQATGETELALAYPGEGTYVRLTLDHHGRIVRETLHAPKHLTTRTILYPTHDRDRHEH